MLSVPNPADKTSIDIRQCDGFLAVGRPGRIAVPRDQQHRPVDQRFHQIGRLAPGAGGVDRGVESGNAGSKKR